MIAAVSLAPGTHQIGPQTGTLEVHTYREGLAQKVGHDLIIDVGDWSATAQVAPSGHLSAVTLQVDTRSLEVREGLRGVKPLSDKDKADIRKSIDEKVLLGQPISFRSDAVETVGGLTIRGELSIVGSKRPASFELELSEDGRITGQAPVVQSEFGIKPYKAFMGALKVRDEVEIVLDVKLPGA
jgi:polyisoprenoid-binding protein YceI